jgi:hypothetical protein
MSPAIMRDALASLTDRELTLLWHALPLAIRGCLRDSLHARLDMLADEDAQLAEFGPRAVRRARPMPPSPEGVRSFARRSATPIRQTLVLDAGRANSHLRSTDPS